VRIRPSVSSTIISLRTTKRSREEKTASRKKLRLRRAPPINLKGISWLTLRIAPEAPLSSLRPADARTTL